MSERPSQFTLVTGASSGIGECFARMLAARKQNLILVARSKDKLMALGRQLSAAHGIAVEPMECDLSIAGAAERLAGLLHDRDLQVDLLINNAGFGARGKFQELALERQSQMIRLNVMALVELTHFLLPAMVEAHRGGIINVSSTASFQPVPYTTIYGATKAFVTSFSLGLAEELLSSGVSVVTFCPGGTRTNFGVASQYGETKLPGGSHSPEEVVRVALIALDRGGGLAVPGLKNKAGVLVQRFVPRSWVVKGAARIFKV
ncbi:MAG TPA: SDR family oxidoreductase [Terriglobia bacterium]|nr:SDR family oxidoreductase [Terriglobia bacterium]